MSDRRKRMDLQAESVLDGLRLMVATCDEHDLPGTHEVRVTADFARGLLRELEQLREQVRRLREAAGAEDDLAFRAQLHHRADDAAIHSHAASVIRAALAGREPGEV